MGPQLIDEALIRTTVERARGTVRRRINHNLHSGPEDNPHRFLNALLKGSYVAPHRHVTPPKPETFLVLEGRLAVFCFSDSGEVESVHVVGDQIRGIDLPAGIWHTIAALSEYVVCLEIKPGPWDPAADKEFAPWAPMESDPGASEYLDWLLLASRSAAHIRRRFTRNAAPRSDRFELPSLPDRSRTPLQ
jgi:cupin fold WbuC family metalloprotein